jgi:hypothetical protein
MATDIWHFSRAQLAEQVIGMFNSGLSTALIFFAPRRMGKTEFLRKDIIPVAKAQHWKIFYFSFLDVGQNASEAFTHALAVFAEENAGLKNIIKHVSKISGSAGAFKAELEFNTAHHYQKTMKEIMDHIAKKGKTLLLMDEVQVLAKENTNQQFIAALRTVLDINKDTLKVIFTGSSREGLRQMFSEANAPFFHFGQNLPFPLLQRDFTDHLATIFKKVTQRELDKDELWQVFITLEKVPQLMRSLVERLALQPTLSIKDAKKALLSEVSDARAYREIWNDCSPLEKLIIKTIAHEEDALYSEYSRGIFATQLGIPELTVARVQSALRSLHTKGLIGKEEGHGQYYIDDPNFKRWVLEQE